MEIRFESLRLLVADVRLDAKMREKNRCWRNMGRKERNGNLEARVLRSVLTISIHANAKIEGLKPHMQIHMFLH